MHLIKEINKVISNKDLMYVLKVKTDTAIDSIIIVGIKTLLNTASIAL